MIRNAHDQSEFSQIPLRMTEMWRSNMREAVEMCSMIPFSTTRAADSSPFAAAQGDQISKAIKHKVEGSRLADMWNLYRQVHAAMVAWMDLSQRMAVYLAIASAPWSKAYERYGATLADTAEEDAKAFNWHKAFEAWSAIANEELISNQRSEKCLVAQCGLLRASLDLRACQQEIAETIARLFGVPNQQDFDELTRQITELRRELRASLRAQRDAAEGAASPDNQERK
ncbi:hypothetical protein F4V91_31455 [Neorhizobium galegae]|uniref:Poly(3-hydroxyalkanoate) polymerase subunit PhaE n=1 Tax=Neorhizobium galegae TaxID=399 RepID=A0A6A1TIW0_NEOGA|nr:poly(R)-hydroxyalkanoic acid synthase subunit PhaE [Neorhizobium galegae]KAB1083933.1 hypothetical protein F4V91_31455 [Neorhizobium galegae]